MLVASAERSGLYANLTRIVELEEPDPGLARRLRACDEILARLREEATRPGRTLAEAFADAVASMPTPASPTSGVFTTRAATGY